MTDGYRVLLRNNHTREERWVNMDDAWDEHTDFMWTDGNYGCDCNRHLFFERAMLNSPGLNDCPCGDELYTAIRAELPDGTVWPLDD